MKNKYKAMAKESSKKVYIILNFLIDIEFVN